MELKDLVKYYVPMRMEGSSPPNWEVVFGYDISKFKGYNVDEVRVALNLTQLWLSQGPRDLTLEGQWTAPCARPRARSSPLPQKKHFLDPSGPRKGQNSLHKSSFGVPKTA